MDSTTSRTLQDLRKRRRFVRVIVVAGIAVSIAANVVNTNGLIEAGIAGWPPVALLLSLEVLTRVPTSKRLGAVGRVMATIGVAFASGWLSYWHMASTVSQYGETGGSQYIWPVSVDGLMTIAAIALVELGARIRVIEEARQQSTETAIEATPAPVVQESPEVLAFRDAQRALRTTSALAKLNAGT